MYNLAIHSSSNKYPHVFDDKGKYIPCQVGLKVIMSHTEDGRPVYYEVVKIIRSRGGDWLYDSDCINCDLKYSHIGELLVNKI